jgi:hypothetical protein
MAIGTASLFIALATLVAIGNMAGVYGALRRQRQGISGGYSCVPVLSISFAFVARSLASETVGWWAFLPAVLDPGTWVVAVLPIALPWAWLRNRV